MGWNLATDLGLKIRNKIKFHLSKTLVFQRLGVNCRNVNKYKKHWTKN
jgi:hypothetical protein